jgi:hypothetical protein
MVMDQKKIESLVEQLAHYETRGAARRQLLEIGPAAAPALLEVLGDESLPENMRWAVMTLLAAWRIREACEPLLVLAGSGGNLRGEAIRALESITGLEIGDQVEEWRKALQNPEAYAARLVEQEQERKEATETLGGATENKVESAVDLFKKALEGVAAEISWENDGGYLYLRIPLEAGRKQQMVVTFDDINAAGQPAVTIYTECGNATDDALDSITRRNVTTRYGKFEVEEDAEGGKKVIMRQQIPVNRLGLELARDAVVSMAMEADSFEFELTGADHI